MPRIAPVAGAKLLALVLVARIGDAGGVLARSGSPAARNSRRARMVRPDCFARGARSGALRGRRRVGCERQGQLAARGDPEFGEHAVEMCRDRAVREVEPLSDLAVRETVGCELCDLQLLWCEAIARLRIAASARLSRRAQLAACTVAPGDATESVEYVAGTSEPSGDVAVSLLTEYHRDSTLKWKRNHIFDIDALSVAVPYCDAVVADGDAIDKLRRSRVAERLGTPIFPSLADLVAHLS